MCVEANGAFGLLRSLAVRPRDRNQGLATLLVDHAVATAAADGVRDLFLLTTTAAEFFSRRGFERVDRTAAPPEIAATTEFGHLCPSTAAFLWRSIQPPIVREASGTWP